MTGGGQFSEASCYVTNIIVLSVFFWYCMEVPDPILGGIVQSVTPSMPGKLNSTCVLVLLFMFKLHFLNPTIVSLTYSVEYTYQGLWEVSPGFPQARSQGGFLGVTSNPQARSQGGFLGVTSNPPLKLMIFIARHFASLKN